MIKDINSLYYIEQMLKGVEVNSEEDFTLQKLRAIVQGRLYNLKGIQKVYDLMEVHANKSAQVMGMEEALLDFMGEHQMQPYQVAIDDYCGIFQDTVDLLAAEQYTAQEVQRQSDEAEVKSIVSNPNRY